MTLVQLSNLSKSFESQAAVASLNLKLESGTVLGLLGPNGAGKSTCLKLLVGILQATEGQVQLFGKDVHTHGSDIRQQIGYVPDNPQLYPWMTVAEVMRFAAAAYGSWSNTLADDLCHTFELPRERRIKHLSRGMKVKAALLVALAHRPRLLVLDEPMSGLDPLVRDELLEILVNVGREKTECIIFSSHQIDDVTRLADEIAILNEGHLLVHQSVEMLLQKTKRIEAVLADGHLPDIELPQLIWQQLNRRQWSITVTPFDSGLITTLNELHAISSTHVDDLSLEQIFKDWIRGSKTQC